MNFPHPALLIILFIAVVTLEVDSLFCYVCQATDSNTCNKTQSVKSCSDTNLCVTMSYTFEYVNSNQLKQVNVFRKFCSLDELSCDWLCRSTEEAGNENCEVSCCETNLCNRSVNKQEIYYGLRRTSSSQLQLQPKFFFFISLVYLGSVICSNFI